MYQGMECFNRVDLITFEKSIDGKFYIPDIRDRRIKAGISADMKAAIKRNHGKWDRKVGLWYFPNSEDQISCAKEINLLEKKFRDDLSNIIWDYEQEYNKKTNESVSWENIKAHINYIWSAIKENPDLKKYHFRRKDVEEHLSSGIMFI